MTLTRRQLDDALFAAGIVVVVLFWVADAQSYYYIQAKLRSHMTELQRKRIRRFEELRGYDTEGVGLPIHASQTRPRRVIHAFFNASMLYYFLIAGVLSVAWVMYGKGLIT